MPESRIITADEKTTPAHLINAEGYRKIVAFKFKVGDKVRFTKDPYQIMHTITGITIYNVNVFYQIDNGSVWSDDALELVEEAR